MILFVVRFKKFLKEGKYVHVHLGLYLGIFQNILNVTVNIVCKSVNIEFYESTFNLINHIDSLI